MNIVNVHTTYKCHNCGREFDRFPWEGKKCRYCGSTDVSLTRRFT